MEEPHWVVKSVVPREDYTLLLTFADGKVGIYDAKPDLEKPCFQKQKNIGFFMLAKAMYGSVVWPDDSDIAPEHLYDASVPVSEQDNL